MALFDLTVLRATQGDAPLKYLGVKNDGGKNQSYLSYSTEEVLNPYAKFAVEYAHDGLVHIRSCRTNKYWVRSSTNGLWIVAKGVEPVDETTSWTCTLFRMDVDDDSNATFFHVQSGSTVRLSGNNGELFFSIDPNATTQAVSQAFDYDAFVTLPKNVAFKGDNGLFLAIVSVTPPSFTSNDIGDPFVAWIISTTNEGQIRIQTGYNMDYLTLNSTDTGDNLEIESSKPDGGLYQLYSVIKIKENIIGLRNLKNNNFCRRGEYVGFQDIIMANATGLIKEAQFEVVETVNNRTVKVLEFDLNNARIYNVTPLFSSVQTSNNPTDQVIQAEMDLTMHSTRTTTWTNTVSVTLGVTTTFVTGIPVIAEGKIEVSAETSYEHQWQESREEGQDIGDVQTMPVPPMKKLIAKGVATKATCDIPFSYVQTDQISTTGETIKTILYDGVFTGVNAYDFDTDVRYEDADV